MFDRVLNNNNEIFSKQLGVLDTFEFTFIPNVEIWKTMALEIVYFVEVWFRKPSFRRSWLQVIYNKKAAVKNSQSRNIAKKAHASDHFCRFEDKFGKSRIRTANCFTLQFLPCDFAMFRETTLWIILLQKEKNHENEDFKIMMGRC